MKGAVLLVLLAIAAGAAAWGYAEHGPGFIRLGFGPEPAPPPAWAPPPGPAAPAITGQDVMPWIRDERWQRGVADGEAGVALVELAHHEHFEVQGDPFLFRRRKEEAAGLLDGALEALGALRADYATNAAAVLDIDPLLRKYDEAHGKTVKR